MAATNVRVFARFRPVNDLERERAVRSGEDVGDDLWVFPSLEEVTVTAPSIGVKKYRLDAIFPMPTTQIAVYEKAAHPVVEDVLEGYNGTVFAYGQTGSGKSFSMFGPRLGDERLKGIIPRAVESVPIAIVVHSSRRHMFKKIRDDRQVAYTLRASFLELYNESVNDLVNNTKEGHNLNIRESPSRGVYVDGVTEDICHESEDIYELLLKGEKNRATSATNMNKESSRSHSIFIITLTQKDKDGVEKVGKLNLVDLAGSEKVGKTGAEGQTLKEAQKINLSLTALGQCINALTTAKKGTHIPFRNSKLTRMLQESLGGNCKTTLIVAASPIRLNLDETLSTLEFAKRAKTIKNKVTVNRTYSIQELLAMIDKLKEELEKKDALIKKLRDRMKAMKEAGVGGGDEWADITEDDVARELAAEKEREEMVSDVLEEEDESGAGASSPSQSLSSSGGLAAHHKARLTRGRRSSTFGQDEGVSNSVQLAALNVEVEQLRKTIAIKDQDHDEVVRDLRETNDALLLEQEEASNTAAEAMKKEAQLRNELASAQAKLKKAEYTLADTEIEVGTLQDELVAAEDSNEELRKQLSDAQRALVAAKNHQAEALSMKTAKEEQELKVMELEELLLATEEELQTAQDNLGAEKATAIEMLEHVGRILPVPTHTQATELQDRLDEAQVEVEMAKEQAEEDSSVLMEELDEASVRAEALATRVHQLELELNGGTAAPGKPVAASTDGGLKGDLMRVKKDLDSANAEKARILRDTDMKAAKSKRELAALEDRVGQAQRRLADQEKKLSQSRQDSESLMREKRAQEHKMSQLASKLGAATQQAEKASALATATSKQLTKAELDRDGMKLENAALKKRLDGEEAKNKALTRKVQSQGQRIDELEKELAQLREAQAESSQRVEVLVVEVKTRKENEQVLEAKVSELVMELEQGLRGSAKKKWKHAAAAAASAKPDPLKTKIDFSRIRLKDTEAGVKRLDEERKSIAEREKEFRERWSRILETASSEVKSNMVFFF